MTTTIELRPQAGPQEAFLACPADIAVIGGHAGGGKTYGLLFEPMRHTDNPRFGAVIFRRTLKQVRTEGGLWDEASELYPMLGGVPRGGLYDFTFPSGSRVSFGQLEHEKTKYDYKGAQIALLLFDQLEEFTQSQFFYMLSRNRSTCGVRPYVRGSCNPDADSWLAEFLAWWIDQDTGYPIPERSGVIRWFVRVNEVFEWADSPEELVERTGIDPVDQPPKSVTFIEAKLEDNPILTEKDPNYRGNLMLLPRVERERLIGGNWKIRATAGNVFNRSWFGTVPARPVHLKRVVRYWDKAATEGGKGAQSAGVLVGEDFDGVIYILDVVADRWSSGERNKVIRQVAEADSITVPVWVEQEPGSGGKESAEITIMVTLKGWNVHADRVTGDKLTRAGPLAAQAEVGNVKLVEAPWNEAYRTQAHNFDPASNALKDMIDASAGGFNKLMLTPETLWVPPSEAGMTRTSPWG